jgi:hypothetical protein
VQNFFGTMTINDCTVSCNSASAGGGIFNRVTLNVASCKFINNQATSKGGYHQHDWRQRDDRRFADQQQRRQVIGYRPCRGISSEDSVLSLTNCTVNANQVKGATALGGGIYASNSMVNL